MRAGLRCDEKPQYAAPPYSRITTTSRPTTGGGAARRTFLTSFLSTREKGRRARGLLTCRFLPTHHTLQTTHYTLRALDVASRRRGALRKGETTPPRRHGWRLRWQRIPSESVGPTRLPLGQALNADGKVSQWYPAVAVFPHHHHALCLLLTYSN